VYKYVFILLKNNKKKFFLRVKKIFLFNIIYEKKDETKKIYKIYFMNMDMSTIMNYISIINIFIIPTVMFSLKYFIVDISKKQIDEFRNDINREIEKIDLAYSKGYVKMEAKLQTIDEKLDRFISENQKLVIDIKVKLNEIETQNSKINFLDRDLQDNKKHIDKVHEEAEKKLNDINQRLNNRIDDFITKNR